MRNLRPMLRRTDAGARGAGDLGWCLVDIDGRMLLINPIVLALINVGLPSSFLLRIFSVPRND